MSKRAEDAAFDAYPYQRATHFPDGFQEFDRNSVPRTLFQEGYEQAEKDLGWHSVDESLPPVDEEVIVLTDRLNLGSMYAIAIGHIVDKEKAVDYNDWNIPGVKYWMPMPVIPEEEKE